MYMADLCSRFDWLRFRFAYARLLGDRNRRHVLAINGSRVPECVPGLLRHVIVLRDAWSGVETTCQIACASCMASSTRRYCRCCWILAMVCIQARGIRTQK